MLDLYGADGQVNQELLRGHPVEKGQGGLFLALIRVPNADEDRVEFLRVEWTGTADLHIVELAIVRP